MTPQDKLQALVQRAIEGGYDLLDDFEANSFDVVLNMSNLPELVINQGETVEIRVCSNDVLYDHDFAKALWSPVAHKLVMTGTKWGCPLCDLPVTHLVATHEILTCWQYHLQHAVISDDPINYMYEVVFGNG